MKNNKCITKKILESVAEIAAKEYYGDNIYENQGEETLEVAEETLDWVWLYMLVIISKIALLNIMT